MPALRVKLSAWHRDKTDLKISERQIAANVRAAARLKWIDDLHEAIADLTATAAALNARLWEWKRDGKSDDAALEPEISSLTQRFLTRRQAVRMWLNLEKPNQRAWTAPSIG